MDRVAQQHIRRVQIDQYRNGPPIVQVEMQKQGPQRLADGGRVAHQVSDVPEAFQLEALANEQTEMIAGRCRRGFGKQAAKSLDGDPVLGILEGVERDACPHERETRCDSELPQEAWNRSDRTDPDLAVAGGGLR
jgi:hypothetical protein